MTATKGILGTKLGMTQLFDETRAIPITVIKAGPCVVTHVKTKESDGYDAVQLAFGELRQGAASKPMRGHFDKAGAETARHVVELRTDDAGDYEPGQRIIADVFSTGDVVDVVGVSKGHGFSGVMRRHGFAGLRSSHGVQKKHRSPGSIAAWAPASCLITGWPRPGQLGNQRVTVLNLEVVNADAERGLLLIKGAVPGPTGGLVMIRTAVKTPLRKGA